MVLGGRLPGRVGHRQKAFSLASVFPLMREYALLLYGNRNYCFLWAATVVSQLGDRFNLLASAELITAISNSGVAISYLFLARFLPLFSFSSFAGVLADRYSRRYLLIISDVLQAVTVLGFLFIDSPEQIWVLYLLTVVQFSLSALFSPTSSPKKSWSLPMPWTASPGAQC